jgi:hypothetical protein
MPSMTEGASFFSAVEGRNGEAWHPICDQTRNHKAAFVPEG